MSLSCNRTNGFFFSTLTGGDKGMYRTYRSEQVPCCGISPSLGKCLRLTRRLSNSMQN